MTQGKRRKKQPQNNGKLRLRRELQGHNNVILRLSWGNWHLHPLIKPSAFGIWKQERTLPPLLATTKV